MLVRPAAVFEDDFLGSGAGRAEPLLPREFRRRLEGRKTPVDIDCPRFEVPRVRCSTNATIAHRSASTAGDHEARVDSQEEEDMASSVRA